MRRALIAFKDLAYEEELGAVGPECELVVAEYEKIPNFSSVSLGVVPHGKSLACNEESLLFQVVQLGFYS